MEKDQNNDGHNQSVDDAAKEQPNIDLSNSTTHKPTAAENETLSLQNIAKKIDLPYINLNKRLIDENIARRLPESYARQFHAILLAEEDGHYLVG
ncbi:MAG: hypothetical protein KAI17_27160, partial [Thiotrichaceae bacterium]|nr:hypothetical protein [Thiotrichaceae bacterium]